MLAPFPSFSPPPFPTPFKLLRVSLTGPESTGKSTLAAQLAAHYGTSFAPEFAREYLAQSGPHYTPEDLEEIARGQLAAEERAAATAHGVVFCDSDLLVIKIWFEHSFGTCPEWILQHLAQQQYLGIRALRRRRRLGGGGAGGGGGPGRARAAAQQCEGGKCAGATHGSESVHHGISPLAC